MAVTNGASPYVKSTASPRAEMRSERPTGVSSMEVSAAQFAMIQELMRNGATPPQRTIVNDHDITQHDGTAILLPKGMDLDRAATVIAAKREEMEQVHTFTREFPYRTDDGANATANVLHETFGLVVGKEQKLPFGMTQPPEYRTITVALNKTREVPWGLISIPALPGASIQLGAADGPHGLVFAVRVESPKKHKPVIEKLFDDISDELRRNSIYRGAALRGAGEMQFLDLSGFDPRKIVFSDDVTARLDAAIFSVLRHSGATQAAGMKLRRAVVLGGPYGSGKTSLGMITAVEAVANGWTFLSARAGADGLKTVLETAALYTRAVVFIEDIDSYTPKRTDRDAVSEVLDLFDGIATKDVEILLVATTNHIDRVPAGMLRPNRIDWVINISGCDRTAAERLIKTAIATERLADDIDYDAVYAAMPEFQPAWVRGMCDRAQSFAIVRTGGSVNYVLSTEDLVKAAKSLHHQLDLMLAAAEGGESPELEAIFAELMRASHDGVKVIETDGEHYANLKV